MSDYEMVITKLGKLELQKDGDIGKPTGNVWLVRQPYVEGEEITLSPHELRWLIHTGGPAALAAIDGQPKLREPSNKGEA